ncbi:hypothetical protein GOV09_05900 [Candidatus Woesearchaeota archaeon]|nr:hypothetical protein [Candidatus Woesearchaeota archaeon]
MEQDKVGSRMQSPRELLKNLDFLCQQANILTGVYISVARQLTNPHVRKQPYLVDFAQIPLEVITATGPDSIPYTEYLLGRNAERENVSDTPEIKTETMPFEPTFFDYIVSQFVMANRLGASQIVDNYMKPLRVARDHYIESRAGWVPSSKVDTAEVVGIGELFGDATLVYKGIE